MLQDKAESAFSILMAGFVMVLVLTNIIGVKLFLAFPEVLPNGLFGELITLTTGILTYPITSLFTDVVCEVYGRKRANLMVYTGFAMSLLSLILVQIALVVPGSPVSPAGNPNFETVVAMQTAFDSVFTLPCVLIFASMSAYLVAQLMDVRLFHFWKRVTHGRHLWLRNNGLTMVSQLVDTVIVNSIFSDLVSVCRGISSVRLLLPGIYLRSGWPLWTRRSYIWAWHCCGAISVPMPSKKRRKKYFKILACGAFRLERLEETFAETFLIFVKGSAFKSGRIRQAHWGWHRSRLIGRVALDH